MNVNASLPIARYRFTFRVLDVMPLPEYAGSLLRGQFGDALRRTVCLTGMKKCSDCPLYRSCVYPTIFDTPAPVEHALQKFSAVPNPYVIEPPPLGAQRISVGGELMFDMVLVGRALAQFPLITFAFQRAFRQGITKVRAKACLLYTSRRQRQMCIRDRYESVWDAEVGKLQEHDASISPPANLSATEVTLQISTPLRLQHQGRALHPGELTPRTLLTNLMRRVSLLLDLHAGQSGLIENPSALAKQADSLEHSRSLHWHDWTRYSSRQKQEMTLGGVLGEWTLKGNLEELSFLLWVGQWLHAGKNATMGMGKYKAVFN